MYISFTLTRPFWYPPKSTTRWSSMAVKEKALQGGGLSPVVEGDDQLPTNNKETDHYILPQCSPLHTCFCSRRWVSLYSQKIVDSFSYITQRMFRSVHV